MANEVVAHLMSGPVVKGTCFDVDPSRPVCHIKIPNHDVVEVKLSDLKALYFVRTLGGNPKAQEARDLSSADPRARGAFPVEYEFKDGEKGAGLMNRFPPNKPFFYITPADPKSNNLRILVNKDALKSIKEVGK